MGPSEAYASDTGSSGVASAERGSGSTVSSGCPPSAAIACASTASSECSCESSAISSSIGLISSCAIYFFFLTRECVGQLGDRAIADVIHHHEKGGKREDSDDYYGGCGANLFPGRPCHT